MADFVVALGLLLAVEGLLYAAAPDVMRRAVARILDTPDGILRMAGLAMAAVGVVLVWMVRG